MQLQAAIDNHSHNNSPSFFKIILHPTHDLHKLAIPIRFTTEYGTDLSDAVTLKIPTGKTWKVKLVKQNGRVWFKDGWPKIVTYCSIRLGHFLVFAYEGTSQFEVHIFDMTACEIHYPPLTPPNSSPKENGMVALVRKYKRKLDDGQRLTRVDINKINSRRFKNPCFTVVIQQCFLRKYTNAGNMFHMNVPAKFAAKYLRHNEGIYTLENETGDQWPIKCVGGNTRWSTVKFCQGWKEFALDNELRIRDICVFELIDPVAWLFKVDIILATS